MRDNRFDTVLAYANERAQKIRDYVGIGKDKPNVKPFNTVLTQPVDILYIYDKLMQPENEDIMGQVLQRHGAETFAEFEKKALRSRKARGL
jgi:hypothetical protein|tara:strand:+ start:52 stop:324 length:273 start_codon:yes stop_codon:yes gene_type:complete